MPVPFYEFLTWPGWQHIGTVALLMSALPAIALPLTFASTGNWRTSLASKSLMWLYGGIAGVYLYLIAAAIFGANYPGRTLIRLIVFLPLGYGIWRIWITHFRYTTRNEAAARSLEEFQPTADEDRT